MTRLKFTALFIFMLAVSLTACTGTPEGIRVVDGIETQRYLGTWFEIARLDHSFERNLEKVTATYSLRKDGGLRVVNRGYNSERGQWKMAEGKGYFIIPANADGTQTGRLKVSFFGPFYGGYNIIELDKNNYEYVMICGSDRSYLWILSRKPQLAPSIQHQLIDKAQALGFATEKLIIVKH